MTLAQEWERLLFATGGAICFKKSFWFLISWVWTKSGTAKLATIKASPRVIRLTEGSSTDDPITVPRIEATSSYRTLGVRISPSGSTDLAYSHLRSQSITFEGHIANSKLSRGEVYWAFWQYYTPKITFSVPVLTLSQTQCKKIQSPAICATLSKMHLNQHTARAIVYVPACFAGLDLPERYTLAGIGQLRLFLGHL